MTRIALGVLCAGFVLSSASLLAQGEETTMAEVGDIDEPVSTDMGDAPEPEAAAPEFFPFHITEMHIMFDIGPYSAGHPSAGVTGSSFVATFEHFNTWRYGTIWFFTDIFDEPQDAQLDCCATFSDQTPHLWTQNLGYTFFFSPGFSFNQIFNSPFPEGSILREISWKFEINTFSVFGSVYMTGPEILWNIPGFNLFSTIFYFRVENVQGGFEQDDNGNNVRTFRTLAPTWQFTWVWNVSLLPQDLPVNLTFRGFWSMWQAFSELIPGVTNDTYNLKFFSQPQLLIGIDGIPIEIGAEFEITRFVDYVYFSVAPMARFVF